MKKLVIETVVKEVNDDIENIIDKSQFVQEITETINKTQTYINPSSTFTFEPFRGGKGVKNIKIISDIPVKMSYTSQADTYNFGCNMKEYTFLGGGDNENRNSDFIAKYGSISLQNIDTEKTAHIKIIYTY